MQTGQTDSALVAYSGLGIDAIRREQVLQAKKVRLFFFLFLNGLNVKVLTSR